MVSLRVFGILGGGHDVFLSDSRPVSLSHRAALCALIDRRFSLSPYKTKIKNPPRGTCIYIATAREGGAKFGAEMCEQGRSCVGGDGRFTRTLGLLLFFF